MSIKDFSSVQINSKLVRSLTLLAAGCMVMTTLPAQAASDPASTLAAKKSKSPSKTKLICSKPDSGMRASCRKVSASDPDVEKRNGFFQSVMAPLLVGGSGITAAAVNSKNCGKGNNSNTGSGQNSGNCATSP